MFKTSVHHGLVAAVFPFVYAGVVVEAMTDGVAYRVLTPPTGAGFGVRGC